MGRGTKLGFAQVNELRKMYLEGATLARCAVHFDVSIPTIRKELGDLIASRKRKQKEELLQEVGKMYRNRATLREIAQTLHISPSVVRSLIELSLPHDNHCPIVQKTDWRCQCTIAIFTRKGYHDTPRKLQRGDAKKIREAVAEGRKQADVARQFNVTPSMVSQIVNGRIYLHEGGPIKEMQATEEELAYIESLEKQAEILSADLDAESEEGLKV